MVTKNKGEKTLEVRLAELECLVKLAIASNKNVDKMLWDILKKVSAIDLITE